MKTVYLLFSLYVVIIITGCSSSAQPKQEMPQEGRVKLNSKVEELLRPFYIYGMSADEYRNNRGRWPSSVQELDDYTRSSYPSLDLSKTKILSLEQRDESKLELLIKPVSENTDAAILPFNFRLIVAVSEKIDKPDIRLKLARSHEYIDKASKQPEDNQSADVLKWILLAVVLNKALKSDIPLTIDGSVKNNDADEVKKKLESRTRLFESSIDSGAHTNGNGG